MHREPAETDLRRGRIASVRGPSFLNKRPDRWAGMVKYEGSKQLENGEKVGELDIEALFGFSHDPTDDEVGTVAESFQRSTSPAPNPSPEKVPNASVRTIGKVSDMAFSQVHVDSCWMASSTSAFPSFKLNLGAVHQTTSLTNREVRLSIGNELVHMGIEHHHPQ